MNNVVAFVVLVILVLAAVFQDTWFNMLTEQTRDPNTKSKVVYLELNK